MTARDRLRRQLQLEADWATRADEQPNVPPQPIALADRCPARTGARHNISMKGNDGVYRCWYCAKTRAAIEAGKVGG
jgi:hypothetical protein